MRVCARHRGLYLLLGGALIAGCGSEEPSAGSAPVEAVPVAAWRVQSVELDAGRSWGGIVEPGRSVRVEASVAGEVEQVMVRDGDRIGAGDPLLSIRMPGVDARIAPLAERVAQLDDELARWERLAASGAAGPGEVAEARLRALEAREALLDLRAVVGSGVVRAPVSGRVQGVSVARGSNVSSGSVVLTVEESQNPVLTLRVSAAEASYFEDPGALQVTMSGHDAEIPVQRVSRGEGSLGGTLIVELHLGGEVPASRGTALVSLRRPAQHLLVPWTAVATDGTEHWVAALTGTDPPRVERRSVQLGEGFPQGIEVVSGLTEGDIVIRFEPRTHPEGRAVEPLGIAPGGGE